MANGNSQRFKDKTIVYDGSYTQELVEKAYLAEHLFFLQKKGRFFTVWFGSTSDHIIVTSASNVGLLRKLDAIM